MTQRSMACPALLLVPLLVAGSAGCVHLRPRPCPCPDAETAAWPVPCAWLQRAQTPAEAEAAHTVNGVPFGNLHDDWRDLLSQMQPGDTLWSYSGARDCPPGVKCHRPGEDGVLLVRGCKVLKRLTVAYTFTR